MTTDERSPNRKQLARQATESALMDAALRLFDRDGVLVGLNLQEVADEAGVNRGLIHKWFGSRRAFLRAALESRKARLAPAMARSLERDPEERSSWSVKQYARDDSFARIVMLLALDDDDEFDPIPYLDRRIAAFDDEIARGVWAEDADPVALTVLWDVILDGYFTMRKPLARQLRLSRRELDERVFTMVGRMFGSMLRSPATARR